MKERFTIKTMPDKITLEAFLKGMNGEKPTEVIFNTETCEFEWLTEKPRCEPKLGSPKDDIGWKLRH